MSLVRLVSIVIRLYAATLAITAILTAVSLLSTVRLLDRDPFFSMQLANYIGQVIGLTIITLLLFSKSDVAARRIVGADESVRMPGARHLAIVGFALLGISYVVDGLQSGIGLWAMWKFVPADPYSDQIIHGKIEPERIARTVVLLVAGALLSVGARSAADFVSWLRRAPARAIENEREDDE